MTLKHALLLLATAATPFVSSNALATLAPNVNVDGLLLGEPNITGVSTNMGTAAGNIGSIINQSNFGNFGPEYTSLSTDFSNFVNTAVSDANPMSTGWRSATPTGVVTFTLDQPYLITGIGLWQSNAVNTTRQVQGFAVYADTDADTTNGLGTLMGSFTAQQLTTGAPFGGQGWGIASDPWTASTTQFINFEILSNYGDTSSSLGEVVFATVPEPMTLLGASAAAGFGAFFKRRQGKSPKA